VSPPSPPSEPVGARVVRALARVPRPVVFLGVLVVTGAGLFLRGVAGAVLLLAVVAVALALLQVSAVQLTASQRRVRVVILAVVVVVAVAKVATGR